MNNFNKDGESRQDRREYGHSENRGYSSEGRKLRPRKKVSFADSSREGGQRRNYGEHPQGEHRSYGDRPQRVFGSGERRSDGERRFGGEGRSYGDRPQRSYGERRAYSPQDGESRERRNYGDRPQRSYGDRPQRSFGGGERRADSEHRFGGEGRGFGNRPQRNYGEYRTFQQDGESHEGRIYAEHPQRDYGDRPQRYFDGAEHRNGGERRFGGRHDDGERRSPGRKPFGDKRTSKKRKNKYAFNENDEKGIIQMISKRPQVDAQNSDNDYVSPSIQEEIRLNKYIANSGVCSRREADTYIQAGVVTVNGEVVTELGTKVNVLTDDVRFNGERLKGEEKVYIVMNKPKGFVTTASDPHAEKTVMDLLKSCTSRVFPVGRLDKNTTGVLMFTNDGEIAERLTHPSYDKKKIYQVILDHPLSQEDYDKILAGVELSDGEVAADELQYIDAEDKRKLGIEIHSGKNRIVRRIFESLGYEVRALDRVYFAGLTKKGLKKGEWRYLSTGEANILKMGAFL